MKTRWILSAGACGGLLAFALFAQQPNQPPQQPKQPQPGQPSPQPGQQPSDRERQTPSPVRDDQGQAQAKSATELQTMVNQLTIQLPDAIRTAERQAPQAKVCLVEVCEWKNVQSGLKRTSADQPGKSDQPGQPGQPTTPPGSKEPTDRPKDQPGQPKPQPDAPRPGELDTRSQPINRDTGSMNAEHPVVRVVCVGNDRISEIVVCGKSGQVIGTREHTRLARSDSTNEIIRGAERNP